MLQSVGCNQEPREWFVVKTLNNRVSTAQLTLERSSIETFVPKRSVMRRNRSGKRVVSMMPIIPNIIFVNTTRSVIWTLKNRYNYLNIMYDRTTQRRNWGELMTIPRGQMEEFMTFVRDNYENIEVVEDPEALDLTRGERVRVTSGAFEGCVATYISIKGRRSRQIVVKIDGFMAVMATSEFTCERI